MSNRFSKIILIIVTIFCSFLMFLSYTDSSLFYPLKAGASYIVTPVQKGISSFGYKVSSAISENRHLHEVYSENEKLSERIDELTEENNRLREESEELSRLRELFSLDQDYMQYPKMAARVIASSSDSWFNYITLDKGLSSGIEKDMNVLCGGGLFGIVTDVGPNYCLVRSIIDDESNVYAESLSSGVTCLVNGSVDAFEMGYLEISNIAKNATFNDGDAVVTSSLSTKYLPGILIGYAQDVTIDSQHLTKSAKLIPVADFSGIKEVLIITMLRTDTGTLDVSEGELN